MRKILLASMMLIIFVSLTIAQTPTGSLSGTVSSSDGVLPNATVEIKFNNTGKTQTATTNGEGVFTFVQLEPGDYTLKISATGFKTFVANNVKVDIGRDYNM